MFAWVEGFPTQLKTVVRDGDGNMPWADVRASSAFTVAELGELLPTDVNIGGSIAWFDTRKNQSDSWVVSYDYENDCIAEHGSEADARAKMLVYLIENKLVTL